MQNRNSQTEKKKISRRDTLKLGLTAGAAGAAALMYQAAANSGAGLSQAAPTGVESLVKTTCSLCPSGCGLEVRVVDGRAVKVEGNPLHPLNQGVCCLKGQASLEVLYSPERLAHPRIQNNRGSGDWQEISWEEALTLVTGKLADLRSQGLAHTVAWVQGDARGQMRSLVQRFLQAYGTPNLIGRDSLGEGVVRLASYLTQGIHGLPIYDLNNSSYVMTFGGNLLESSRNVIAHLGALAFMRRGRPQRGKLVAVHPRLSLTGVKADEWIPIRPGTYGALALGMANVIINSQLYDEAFVRDFTFGFEDFEDQQGQRHQGYKNLVLERYTLDRSAKITGVPAETIARLAGEFASNRPAVAVLPTEPGELGSGNSLYTAMAIHALNALVGSLDVPGGVLTQRFPLVADWPEWTADETSAASLAQPRLDGAGSAELPLAASVVQNLAGRILTDQPYPVNAMFLCNANPAYELPDDGEWVKALMKVPFVVSFASTLDESAAHADLILPASTFLETWGDDYLEGTGYAGVSLRRPVVETVTDSRDPAEVILELARRLGGRVAQALPYADYSELVKSRLAEVGFEWEKLEENGFWAELVYFNAAPGSPAWGNVVGRDRLNAPKDGRFDFFSRELLSLLGVGDDLACLPHFDLPETLADHNPRMQEYPLLLVTQPLITQSTAWQGIVPTLQESYGLQSSVKWSSWVELNARVAENLGIQDGDLVWVESLYGKVQVPARRSEGLWPNAVYLPPGQGHRTLVSWGRHSPENLLVGVNSNSLIKSQTEPLSGAAVLGPTRVKVYK